MIIWLTLAAGLVLLIVGADLLVKGASRLAALFGVPNLIIGLTIVAFGTSAPELAVSVKAAFDGEAELAVANVVGSNIVNILLILGISSIILPLAIARQLVRQDVPIMVGLSLLLVIFAQDGQLSKLEGTVFIIALLSYTGLLFWQGRRQGNSASNDDLNIAASAPPSIWKSSILVITGLLLLILGSDWLVSSAVKLAISWGVSEVLIGLTIVAIGTSLPELMTSIVAAMKGERDIAVGNVVGSNIFNIICVLGISGMVSPTPLLVGEQLRLVDIPTMLAVACLCIPFFFTERILSRIEGAFFVLLYIAYTWFLIATALDSAHTDTLEMAILYGLVPLVVAYVVFSFIKYSKVRP